MSKTFEIADALREPRQVFDSPWEVADSEGLTKPQKLAIFKNWQDACRQIQKAQSEGMDGEQITQELTEVTQAMLNLHYRN